MSTLELEETYRGGTGFITETSLVRFVLDRAPDGLSTTELQEITDLLSNKLQQPLRVEPTSPDEYGRARFAVKTQSGSELGDFIVPSSPAQPATAEVKAETDMPSR